MKRIQWTVTGSILGVLACALAANAAAGGRDAVPETSPVEVKCASCHVVPIPDGTVYNVAVGEGQDGLDAWAILYDHLTSRYLPYIDCVTDVCVEPNQSPPHCEAYSTLDFLTVWTEPIQEPFGWLVHIDGGQVNLCCTPCEENQ